MHIYKSIEYMGPLRTEVQIKRQGKKTRKRQGQNYKDKEEIVKSWLQMV